MKWCVFIVLSLTFLFVALQGSVGEIRTNYEHFSLEKDKNSQAQTKFTGSYKKEQECIIKAFKRKEKEI